MHMNFKSTPGEELGETERFCQTSQLAAFVLENLEDGSFRAVSLGTGSKYEDSNAEAYSKSFQTTKMEFFAKLVFVFQPLTIFAKSCILNI